MDALLNLIAAAFAAQSPPTAPIAPVGACK